MNNMNNMMIAVVGVMVVALHCFIVGEIAIL